MTPAERDRQIDAAADHARWATKRIGELQREIRDLAFSRRAHMLRLAEMGLTRRQIADLLKISNPRVTQVMGTGWKIARQKRVG